MGKMSYARKEDFAIVTFDDGKVNVMNWEFFRELNACLDRAEKEGVKGVIFTGRPGVFSAGLDLKLLPTQSLAEQIDFQRLFAETMLRVYTFPIPTIAAYAGHAIAGGVILSCACDWFILGDGPYRIQVNEVRNKMVLPSWIALICRSSVPHRYWKEALLHAQPYSPREAYERGIADELVPEGGDCLARALEKARDLSQLYLPAYALTKKFMRDQEAAQVMAVFEKELLTWRLVYNREAIRE
ncbi:MAG TPA: enoyl-CoA hydratase-related protein [Syntrophales bacterium]|nr:enoyl-CoA hydratase-related protein [Syntrophales bacterium]HOL59480.1 enoyl-CoA hydratase-related protein [Syntrophales bacterium]HPO34662.1 enoyl-CoA hydratase-related protein [Syntrophales bacterium]